MWQYQNTDELYHNEIWKYNYIGIDNTPFIKHYKYIKREKKSNGKWRYYYNKPKNKYQNGYDEEIGYVIQHPNEEVEVENVSPMVLYNAIYQWKQRQKEREKIKKRRLDKSYRLKGSTINDLKKPLSDIYFLKKQNGTYSDDGLTLPVENGRPKMKPKAKKQNKRNFKNN